MCRKIMCFLHIKARKPILVDYHKCSEKSEQKVRKSQILK